MSIVVVRMEVRACGEVDVRPKLSRTSFGTSIPRTLQLSSTSQRDLIVDHLLADLGDDDISLLVAKRLQLPSFN
jgi:hypothetical protein